MRRRVLEIYQAALRAVHGRDCVRRTLVDVRVTGPVRVCAIGKAACAMAQGAADAWGDQIQDGLVITKQGYVTAECSVPALTVMEAGHPLPDARSVQAGEAMLKLLAETSREATLLFLISGGASSLIEVLPPGVMLADLRRVNAWLLASGWDIHRMNAVRKGLSCIKGGRLVAYLGERRTVQLLISDVPGDEAADIGSGLLVPAARLAPVPALPDWLQALLDQAPPLLPVEAPADAGVETRIVASLDQALAAAAQAAREGGYAVQVHAARLHGDAALQGRRIADELIQGPAGVHLWGGETTLVLPPQSGRGGRNQHLALAAATGLAGHDDICLLAAGTDGSDGPGEDAGALVDGATLARGALDELNAEECLARADAGTFLEASGDLISTGPTGTNVMDLAIGWKG